MLYYKDLEEILFSKHHLVSEEPDEFVVISGYIGPSPVKRLAELPMKTTVIGGMYPYGIDARLWNSLEESKKNNKNLAILFSKEEIHSKIYIWKKNGKILTALIGSANFSSNGLRNDYRESLAEATRDTYAPLEEYYNYIVGSSSEIPVLNKKQVVVNFPEIRPTLINPEMEVKYTVNLPLYSTSKSGVEYVAKASGLNWGFSNGHISKGDAYIPLPKDIVLNNPTLIKPLDSNFKTPEGTRKRNSDPIELIWDDGFVMPASFEGVQLISGHRYPKQLTSYSKKRPYIDGKAISRKSIIGRYLRKRLGVEVDDLITTEVLEKYGRKTVTLSLIEEGVYYVDFSV